MILSLGDWSNVAQLPELNGIKQSMVGTVGLSWLPLSGFGNSLCGPRKPTLWINRHGSPERSRAKDYL
jgi:hypothetical protein